MIFLLKSSFRGAFFVLGAIIIMGFKPTAPPLAIKLHKKAAYWEVRYELPVLDSSYVALQIALVHEKEKLDHLIPGLSIEQSLFFEPGSGFAMEAEKEVDELFISDEDGGHNFIFYENEKMHRAKLIRQENGIQYLRIRIKKVVDDDGSFKVKKYPKKLYACFFADLNEDQIMNEGEFKIVALN